MQVLTRQNLAVILRLFLAWILLVGSICAAQENKTEENEATPDKFSPAEAPPVRRIVFFNSGIAQIVHQGSVVDNQSVEISFDRDQIDDVLKSLVFDNESGVIESVQYQPAPGKESLAAEQLGPPMTLAQTLQSYRGELVSLTIGKQKHAGSILGVETRDSGDTSEEVVTLVTEEGIRSYKLADAETVHFEAEKVQEEFRLAMIGLTNARDVERKALSMYFAGTGNRKIQFGYVVDAPVWRMTYRLDINKKTTTLQGWAHVDNVTGFDWENVYIDLRSGRPQAFNVELFSPLVALREKRDRSVFGIPADLNLVARYFGLEGQGQFDGGFGGNQGGGWFGGGGQGGGQGQQGGGMGGGGGFGGGTFGQSNSEQDQEARQPLEIGDGVNVAAAQGRAASMLQFAIEKPVNLASGRSAMLPILKQPVAIVLMTRFDLTRNDPTAELVAKMTNGKQFSIVAGPVTVYQDGGFTGDAELPRIDIGQKEVLVYGTDQPLSLSVAADPLEKIYKRVRFDDANLSTAIVVERVDRVKRRFHFSNKDTSARKILLQLFSGRAETDPKPKSRRDGTAQFEYELPADTRKTETITFDTANEERLQLSGVKPEMLKHWQQTDATIDPEVEKHLQQYFELSTNVKELSDRKSELEQHIKLLLEEIERLTGIIQAVKSEATAAPFVEQITEREKTLASDRVEFDQVFRSLNEAKQKLDGLLERDSSKQNSSNQNSPKGKSSGGLY